MVQGGGHGGHGGRGASTKQTVLLFAVLICVLNFYVYYMGPNRTTGEDRDSALLGEEASLQGFQSNAHEQGQRSTEPLPKHPPPESVSRKEEQPKDREKNQQHRRDRTKPKNVLFIMTDDLRPSLSIYDKPVITPAFERLAKMGVVFERAYNQDPICNPSRNSMLSGRRPDTARVWLFEAVVPYEYSNIFRYFREEGKYKVYGTGKLWHWTDTWKSDWHNDYWPVSADDWNTRTDVNYPLMNASVQPDSTLPEDWYFDYQIATKGIELMKELHGQDQPWFLGVGFHQPHRPWHMPKKYWDLYRDMKIPLTPHTTWPEGAPTVATGDINPIAIGLLPHSEKVYWASPQGGVGLDAIYENVRGYYASVSFLDHQLGRLLDAVEELKLADDTVIMFSVDHGMNIGDHGMWDKRTLYETNARVPLIIHDPDFPDTFGMSAPALVENVDIFPTLIDLAGLPDPKDKLFPPLEGKSMVPMLKDPKNAVVKDWAMTQIARCCNQGCKDEDVDKVPWNKWEVCRGGNWEWNKLNERTYMGYSLRTDDWRYVVWVPWNSETSSAEWDKPLAAEELYDHRDPRCNQKGNFDLCETHNLASDESLKSVKEELYARVRSISDTYNLKAWERWKSEQEEKQKKGEA